jgi:hypothetical protein
MEHKERILIAQCVRWTDCHLHELFIFLYQDFPLHSLHIFYISLFLVKETQTLLYLSVKNKGKPHPARKMKSCFGRLDCIHIASSKKNAEGNGARDTTKFKSPWKMSL